MIKVEHAFKRYGSKQALNGISFTVEEGQVVGLLGTNGAGKSTALKAVAGVLRLDRGVITLDGKLPGITTRGMVAYLPDVDVLYSWMKLSDAIRYMKDVYWDWDDRKARHLLDYFELSAHSLICESSKGTRAKMKLLLALSRQAKYVLLDEPFSGIDPFAKQQIAQAIVEDFTEEGQTIVITTHELPEVEAILDQVVILQEGKLLLTGNMETLKQEKGKSLMDIWKEVFDGARL